MYGNSHRFLVSITREKRKEKKALRPVGIMKIFIISVIIVRVCPWFIRFFCPLFPGDNLGLGGDRFIEFPLCGSHMLSFFLCLCVSVFVWEMYGMVDCWRTITVVGTVSVFDGMEGIVVFVGVIVWKDRLRLAVETELVVMLERLRLKWMRLWRSKKKRV